MMQTLSPNKHVFCQNTILVDLTGPLLSRISKIFSHPSIKQLYKDKAFAKKETLEYVKDTPPPRVSTHYALVLDVF